MQLFHDRIDAARQLSKPLEKYRNKKETIIIAIPRGGLKIGAELSKRLGLPLDVFFTKKIGHPESLEFAIGVVGIESESIDENFLKNKEISQEYLKSEIKRIRTSLISREQLYRRGFKPLNLKNKKVIIVDDGVATGNTLLLTVCLIQTLGPQKVIVAVPVGPQKAKERLKLQADEVIFLQTPEDFFAISQFYEIFDQVEDKEAIQLLKEHHGYPG